MNGNNNVINYFSLTDVDSNTNNVDGLPIKGNSMTTYDYTVGGLTFTAKGADTTIDL